MVANPPFSDKRWSTGLDSANDPYERFKPFGAARQAGRLRLPAAHRPHAEEHRQGRASCRTACLPGQCRGRHPPQPRPQGLHQGHHRPARQPVLRHRHPRLHHRRRQGGRPRAPGHLHDRRQQRLHEGRPQEPPARPGHPQDRRCLHPAARRPQILAPGELCGDRENEFNLNLPRYIDSQEPRTFRTSRATCAAAFPTATSLPSKILVRSPRTQIRALPSAPRPLFSIIHSPFSIKTNHLRAPRVRPSPSA